MDIAHANTIQLFAPAGENHFCMDCSHRVTRVHHLHLCVLGVRGVLSRLAS